MKSPVKQRYWPVLKNKMLNCSISRKAHIDRDVVIGPYSIIEDEVVIGAGSKIGSHVIIRSGTTIGQNNTVCSGAHIGVDPQDYHFKGEHSYCRIGNNNVIREYTTISRATGEGLETVIGNGNYIMTYVHVAHNIRIGNRSVISSMAQLGGYVEVGDFANVGGHTGIHQFCRVGQYAMLGAKSYLNKDLPPYLTGSGNRAVVCGVNTTGLVRNLFSWAEIEEIRDIMRLVYWSKHNLTECIAILESKNSSFASTFLDFVKKSKRGILLREDTTNLPEILSFS
jgi:UDP-N-acetylglucosamine acyltransferase